MHNVASIREYFINELKSENFCTDRNGGKTIELIGASFIADEESIFGTVNKDYVNSEIEWYSMESTNINDIYGGEKEPPAAWKMTANEHGEINSNYGHLIWSESLFTQYEHVFSELRHNPDSRRGSMIYTRPSIWKEYNENGKNDFICTNSVTYYIRDEILHCVVQMRSNDVIFGYKNDYAWQSFVLNMLASDLGIETGNIYWQVQNLHVYEKHFNLVNEEPKNV